MRAARFLGNERIEIVGVPDPRPAPGEVVHEAAYGGLCGSDKRPACCKRPDLRFGSRLQHSGSPHTGPKSPQTSAETTLRDDPPTPAPTFATG